MWGLVCLDTSIIPATHKTDRKKSIKLVWAKKLVRPYLKDQVDQLGAGHRWLTPVILATWEVEISRITVLGQLREVVCETLSRKYPDTHAHTKIPNTKRAGEVAQVAEHLPSNPEALNSNPSTIKTHIHTYSWECWYTSVIPAIWKMEMGRSRCWANPGKICTRPYLKKKNN
jgi:hypothetical protein